MLFECYIRNIIFIIMSKSNFLKTFLNWSLLQKLNVKEKLWLVLIIVSSIFFNSCKREIYVSKDIMTYSGKDMIILSAISTLNKSSFFSNTDQTIGRNVYDWDKAIYQSNFGFKSENQVVVPRFGVKNSIDSYLIVGLDENFSAENIEIISAINKQSKLYTDYFTKLGYEFNPNTIIEERKEQLHKKESKRDRLISHKVKRGYYLKSPKVDNKMSSSSFTPNNCVFLLSGTYMWQANIGGCHGLGWTSADQIQNLFLPSLSNYLPPQTSILSNNAYISIEGENLTQQLIFNAVQQALQYMQQSYRDCITTIHLENVNISGTCGGSGGNGGEQSNAFENVEQTMPYWAYLGSKPLFEYADKCSGLNNIWNNYPDNEVFGYVTQDYKLIVTDIVNISGGAVSGLYNHDGIFYYPFSDINGPPIENYSGMVHAAGKYFIPIRASVHTHTPSRYDGTDGVTNFTISSDDNALALAYPTIKHFVIGNGAIGSFAPSYLPVISLYNVEATGSLIGTCNVIY